MNQLILDLENGKVDVIIAKDISRIGRHNAKTLQFVENIRDAEKRLILVSENFDSDTDEDDTLGITTWVNERYVNENSKKVRQIIQLKQETGEFVCAVPYGYKLHSNIKNKILVDLESASYISKIFDMYINGDGYNKIANQLTLNHTPTPSMITQQRKEQSGGVYKKPVTNEWSAKMIMLIIRNDFYTGVLSQGKYKKKRLGSKTLSVPKEEQFIFENNHEAIISKETFNLAQEIRTKRDENNYRGQPVHKNLYASFMKCADCGSYMVALNKEGKNKSYICGKYNKRGKNGCSTHYILDATVTAAIKRYLRYCKDGFDDVILKYERTTDQILQTKTNNNAVIRKLESDLENAKDELKLLMSQKIKEINKNSDMEEIISQSFDELLREKMELIKVYQNQIVNFKDINSKTQDMSKNLRTCLEIFNGIIEKDEIERRDLELIIDCIIVSNDGTVEVNFKSNISSLATCSPEEYNKLSQEDTDLFFIQSLTKILEEKQSHITVTWVKRNLNVGQRKSQEFIDKLLELGLIKNISEGFKRKTVYELTIKKVDPNDIRVKQYFKDNQDKRITDVDKFETMGSKDMVR